MTAREKQRALYEQGIASSMDDAAHMLVDMGDIDSTEHEELLSDEEAARVYGVAALEDPDDGWNPHARRFTS